MKKGKAQREELGVILYGAQQQLARLQVELEKSQDRRSQAATARGQLEEELEGLRLTHKKMCQNTDDERKKSEQGSPCSTVHSPSALWRNEFDYVRHLIGKTQQNSSGVMHSLKSFADIPGCHIISVVSKTMLLCCTSKKIFRTKT